MGLEIRRLDDDEAGWDRFVRSAGDASVFHLSAWRRVVSQVFRHVPHYLAAMGGDEIRAVLPLFEVRGLLTGRILVSTPYSAYGGLCGTDPAARTALLDSARRLAEETGCRYVELRHLHAVPGLPTRSLFATFLKPLDPDPDANLAVLPRKRRAMIRRGISEGFESRRGWEPLPAFHDLYVRNRHRLGSPPFPAGHFEAIRDEFGEEAGLLTIWQGRRLVAGVLSFFFRDHVVPYYGASLPGGPRTAVNDFLYWELMRTACLDGCRVFDFGQSHPGSGTWAYKRHWGFEPTPVPYQYLASDGRAPATGPPDAGFGLLKGIWRRLPLSVTRRVGPFLARRLPLH